MWSLRERGFSRSGITHNVREGSTGTTFETVYFYFDVEGTNGITVTYAYKLTIGTITTYIQVIQ